jgi:hypothetical protein
MTWAVTTEAMELRVGAVVQFIDVFTGDTNAQVPKVMLEVELPDLDRDDQVVLLNGQEVRRFRPSGLKAFGTLQNRVSFPALDQLIAPIARPAPIATTVPIGGRRRRGVA